LIPGGVVIFTLVSPINIANVFNICNTIHEWTGYVESVTHILEGKGGW
jgi:hypothetical protein